MVEDLKLRINAFFEDKEHKELCTNPYYIRLFPHLAQQTHQATAASVHTSGPSNSHEAIHENNQYNHFTTLPHNTQSNHAWGHTPVYPSIFPHSPYHPSPSHSHGSSHPDYIAHIPSYCNINTYPSR